ncbi:hypothetical protein [Nodosilinea sp. E11]|uniref:Orn/Lys/Arg family decarboxylase n=1 Tax=Nodosilinea sp. E11 TaxID=3037479 RepID=UPI00293446D4|nr:hypothetical protein [Nodosilinea sp. E11]WOD37022.1 hypothetical protein RRF56_00760 [Nodosilinea sp. E11]
MCSAIHQAYSVNHAMQSNRNMYTTLPEPAMRPIDAYDVLVHGRVGRVDVEDAIGRVAAAMVVPYPPGIPVIMPGEQFTPETQLILEYLRFARDFDRQFPGFENEIHGLRIEEGPLGKRYLIDCVHE